MKKSYLISNFFKSIVIGGGLLTFTLFSNAVLADVSWTTGAYANNEDRSQVLSITNATSLKVNVFGSTEKNWDFLYIYDKDDNQIKKIHGNNLSETFEVTGDSIRARLTTNSSVIRSGVTVSIEDNFTADSMLIRFTDTNQDQQNNNIYQLEQAINQLTTTSNPITLTFVEYNSQFNTTVIDLSKAVAHDVIYRLALESYVAYSEPNVVFSVASATLEPNDPKYISDQWHYKAFTETNGGINLPKAWAITTGGVDDREVDRNNSPVKNIVVAVIDTGITKHVDLVDNILKNDDDSAYGYDFHDGDSNPIGTAYHATHVAGTIAVKSDNNEGVAGINWQAKILPVRVTKGWGTPNYQLSMMKGLIWASGGRIDNATDNEYPAKVINMSLRAFVACGNPYANVEKSTIQNAINIATSLGATVIVSAGNENKNVNTQTPANCENVIAVGATQQNKNRPNFSNYGIKLDVSAPGVNIYSTYPNNTYKMLNGTSMAAPPCYWCRFINVSTKS